MPLFFSHIKPDLYFVGFEVSATEAKGNSTPNASNPGWFIAFEERAGEIVFGADEERKEANNNLTLWDNLSWKNILINNQEVKFLDTNAAVGITLILGTNDVDFNIKWGTNAADMAYALYQKPSRVFIHSNDMLN